MISGLENPFHLLIVLVVVLLLFGAKRLPEIGRSLGTGMRGFKDALTATEQPDPPTVAAITAPETRDLTAHNTGGA